MPRYYHRLPQQNFSSNLPHHLPLKITLEQSCDIFVILSALFVTRMRFTILMLYHMTNIARRSQQYERLTGSSAYTYLSQNKEKTLLWPIDITRLPLWIDQSRDPAQKQRRHIRRRS